MTTLSQRFQIVAYFDYGNGEIFSRVCRTFGMYPQEARIAHEIEMIKKKYEVCKFKYAKVEKIYTVGE